MQLVKVVMGVLVLGAFSSMIEAGPDHNHWIVVHVGNVEVAHARPDGSPWDTRDDSDPVCDTVKLVSKVVHAPVVKAATMFCTVVSAVNAADTRDFSAPDLFVTVASGSTRYSSSPVLNSYSHDFDYSVIVPLEAVDASGLQLEIFDADGTAHKGELIGVAKLTRRDIAAAVGKKVDFTSGSIKHTELTVLPYKAPAPVRLTFSVDHEPESVGITARAGEMVRVVANGRYSVRSNGEKISEQGDSSTSWTRYDLKDVNLGRAVAFIGDLTESAKTTHTAISVGSCLGIVAPIGGEVFVGINDNDLTNNNGTLDFQVDVGPPAHLQMWRDGGPYECDGQAAKQGAALVDPDPLAGYGEYH